MKIAKIQVHELIQVYIINKYKGFAQVTSLQDLNFIQNHIEEKLQCKILMVRCAERLNVIEFYIIGELGAP